jgi:DNA polymerase-3 subunit epsilon
VAGKGSPVKLVAFDLETTGLEMERDRVLEFCFIELDDTLAELGRWSRLVDPGVAVSKEIEDLTGISTAMVKGQPPFSAHAPRIQALVKDAVLIAHNHSFDVPFLDMELRRAGQPGLAADHPCIDTLVIERHVNSHRLSEVYKRYVGQEFDGGHRSEADVLATVEVLRRQRAAHAPLLPPGGLEGLLATNIDRHFGGDKRVKFWLDHGHRFYRDPGGVIRLGFGPHRGCPAIQLHACVNGVQGHHEEFLRWMLRRDFPAETKATVEMILRANAPRPFSAPGPSAPGTVLPAFPAAPSAVGSPFVPTEPAAPVPLPVPPVPPAAPDGGPPA